MDVFQASQHHQSWCLPNDQPEQCSDDTWNAVKEAFDGDTCPLEKHLILLPIEAEIPEELTVTISTPEYLKVPDYELCLEIYQVGTSALSEYCLPRYKPRNCAESSWKKLQRVFTGIGCSPKNVPSTYVGTPPYLNVPSYRDCLGDHFSPSGSHVELCLPRVKPETCPLTS